MAEIRVEVNDRTPELFQKLEAAVGEFIKKGVQHLGGQVKAKMEAPKTGRMYGRHQASAPGEPPAVDDGNLIGSITEIFPSTLEGLVGTNVEYAIYLEEGTSAPATRARRRRKGQQGPMQNLMGPHRGGMAARPVWEVTRTESLPTLEQMLDAEIAGIGKRT